MAEDTRVSSQPSPPLQPSTTGAWIHISALTFFLSLASSETLLIASCVCQSKSTFPFFSFLPFTLLLTSSLSLLARVMRAGLLKWIPSERYWSCKHWPGSVEPLGILHNALSKREGFCCHPNHTFHLYEQITQEKLNLALEQGRVKAALPLRAIQESQNKLAKHYRDDGVCRNKTTPWWTGLECGGFLIVFITLSSWRSTHYVLVWRRASS